MYIYKERKYVWPLPCDEGCEPNYTDGTTIYNASQVKRDTTLDDFWFLKHYVEVYHCIGGWYVYRNY